MIFHSWEHRRRLRLAFEGDRGSEIDELQSSRKQERARVIAILDSALALGILFILGFTLLFVYSVNEEHVSETLIVIMAAPFVLNALQLIMGIILLCITKKDTRHLGKCRKWCYTAKFLSGLILFELFILLQWQFRTFAFGLFGIQYLLRIAAIHKVKKFMEDLISRNPSSNMAVMRRDNFRQMTEVTCAVPLYTTTATPSSLPGYYDLEIRVDSGPGPGSATIPNSNEPVPSPTGNSLEYSDSSSNPPSYEEQNKLPSYIEAMASLQLKTGKLTVPCSSSPKPNPDPPPSYNDAVNTPT